MKGDIMENNPIPPKNEWVSLSDSQLLDVKFQLMQKYQMMRRSNASFANQYFKFVSDLDALLMMREREKASQD